MNTVTEFVVDRETWARNGCTYLLDSKGNRCCLGFYGSALGIEDSKLLDRGVPWETETKKEWPDWTMIHRCNNQPTVNKIIHFNDYPDLDQVERETKITELFATQGVKVTFIN